MCPPPNATSAHESRGNTTRPSTVPNDPIAQAAYTHARTELHPDILAHSTRVFLLAEHLSRIEQQQWHESPHLPYLFTACLFHDIGTSSTYNTLPLRFEIQGADAASQFLASQGVQDENLLRDVWLAIALHDTPQIPEKMGGLVRILRLAVAAEFKGPSALQALGEERDVLVKGVEEQFPRGNIEKVLGDVVVEQAMQFERPEEKAPSACWPGGLLQAKLAEPEWEGVNKAFLSG